MQMVMAIRLGEWPEIYKSVPAASKALGIAEKTIYACINTGRESNGWCFDYKLDKKNA